MNNLDDDQQRVLNSLHDGKNLFLSGYGGTGKSRVLKQFLAEFAKSKRNVVTLAPTGFAAQNLPDASTIHRFFRFSAESVMLHDDDVPFNEKLQGVVNVMDTLLIDEISMVRVDVFNAIDVSLRHHSNQPDRPFGGKQIVVAGDFFQLPPVISEPVIGDALEEYFGGVYAFNAPAWEQANFENIFLTNIHRQNDRAYIELLNSVRTVRPGLKAMLDDLNVRLGEPEEDEITLCCRNAQAEEINRVEMKKIQHWNSYISHGSITGVFHPNDLPTALDLELKLEAIVMIICNGKHQHVPGMTAYEYVNGEGGHLIGIDPFAEIIAIKMLTGRTVKIKKSTWENYAYEVGKDEDGRMALVPKLIGTFRQYPLLPAWAISIHKAQGQTLSRMHLCLGRGCFASGQLYTALSRVRDLQSLSLDRPIRYEDALQDPQVTDFSERTFPGLFGFGSSKV